jgi:hypothetical protein
MVSFFLGKNLTEFRRPPAQVTFPWRGLQTTKYGRTIYVVSELSCPPFLFETHEVERGHAFFHINCCDVRRFAWEI